MPYRRFVHPELAYTIIQIKYAWLPHLAIWNFKQLTICFIEIGAVPHYFLSRTLLPFLIIITPEPDIKN